MTPRFFADAAAFRRWLEKNHDRESELWIGFHKKASGKPSITYPEAVDQALCYGWIDGVKKSLDADSYVQRFSPRKAKSIWSAVNLKKFAALVEKNLVAKPGLEAYERRDRKKTNLYSFENRPQTFPPNLEKRFRANRAAWKFFEAQPPSYRRTATWWVVSAKREETRLSRLEKLIKSSAKSERLF
jgi:uncharacterized protein YdeI (YjbR/CyaY-like superfamily)